MRYKLMIAGVLLLLFCTLIFAGSWAPLGALRASLIRVFIPMMRAPGSAGRLIISDRDAVSSEECKTCEKHEQALSLIHI